MSQDWHTMQLVFSITLRKWFYSTMTTVFYPLKVHYFVHMWTQIPVSYKVLAIVDYQELAYFPLLSYFLLRVPLVAHDAYFHYQAFLLPSLSFSNSQITYLHCPPKKSIQVITLVCTERIFASPQFVYKKCFWTTCEKKLVA